LNILFIYCKPSIDITGPLGLLHVISVAKSSGHNCMLLIPNLEKTFIQKAVDFNPDVVGYSVTTGFEKKYLRINSDLKKRISFISVFGGPHPTFYPDLIKEKGVDCICRGEAEQSFKQLLQKIENNEKYFDVPNFWFKNGNEIIKNDFEDLIADLDSLPIPDRELIDKYFDYKSYGKISIMTGRGCPFNCSYCFNHKLQRYYTGKGTYVRKRSVDNVIAEIKGYFEKYGIKEIYFVDDIFTIDKKWLAEFSEKYRKNFNIPFICHLRVELVTEEVIQQLKASNCLLAYIGIESGNPELRKKVLNRRMSNDLIIDACNLLKKYKIKLATFNMVGLPHESLDNALETIGLNIKCHSNMVWVSLLQPYPGTDLYKHSKEENILKENLSIKSNYHNSSLFKIEHSKHLENLHDFFAICVDFPFLIPWVKKLIKLPKNKFFNLLGNGYKLIKYIRVGEIRLNRSFMKNVWKSFFNRRNI